MKFRKHEIITTILITIGIFGFISLPFIISSVLNKKTTRNWQELQPSNIAFRIMVNGFDESNLKNITIRDDQPVSSLINNINNAFIKTKWQNQDAKDIKLYKMETADVNSKKDPITFTNFKLNDGRQLDQSAINELECRTNTRGYYGVEVKSLLPNTDDVAFFIIVNNKRSKHMADLISSKNIGNLYVIDLKAILAQLIFKNFNLLNYVQDINNQYLANDVNVTNVSNVKKLFSEQENQQQQVLLKAKNDPCFNKQQINTIYGDFAINFTIATDKLPKQKEAISNDINKIVNLLKGLTQKTIDIDQAAEFSFWLVLGQMIFQPINFSQFASSLDILIQLLVTQFTVEFNNQANNVTIKINHDSLFYNSKLNDPITINYKLKSSN